MLNGEQIRALEESSGNHRGREFKDFFTDDAKFLDFIESIRRRPMEGKSKFRILRNLATLFERSKNPF